MTEPDVYANIGALGVPDSETIPSIAAPKRGAVHGSRFAVATDQPLASQAAMNVMQRGGNAADAAVAAAMVNVVTKPHRTHLGGDCFFLVWRRGQDGVDCLNAGGLAPAAADLSRFPSGIPLTGPMASSVPGFVDGLLELHQTYATRSLDVDLEAAIRYAEEGFPVSMRLAGSLTMLPSYTQPWSGELRRVLLKDGTRPYAPGEILRQPDLAETLQRLKEDVQEEQREGFYKHQTADMIDRAMRDMGGLIEKSDFEENTAVWGEPLTGSYRGCSLFEQALPTQGMIVLEALNILESFPLADWGVGSADALHVIVEATKIAFADSRRYNADPIIESVPIDVLLSKDYAKQRANDIDLKRAGAPPAGIVKTDTTSFVVADETMAIAFIQSIFAPWGSRVMIPGTGVIMNNRLSGFSTQAGAANVLKPGKRTVHTLNNFMAVRDGELVCGGGTPGGDYQVQNNIQTLVGVIDWGLDLQSVVDMPRWVMVNDHLAMESRFPASVMDELTARGHKVAAISAWDGNIARSQLVASTPGGGWAVASDLRGEGVALGL
ncbi:MAG TPA: gamma-glutamyltransferase family protein [Dehalococcoidia bacterium]|nr:gamma-glutamyltransferase family protein [Dehalococcoidia bacterium]